MRFVHYSLRFIPFILCACVPGSKSLGEPDDTSTGSEGSTTATTSVTDTTGPNPGTCEPTPSFTCTVPYDGSFGECGGNDFDESCCLRETCSGHDDCSDGEVCVPAGTSGMSCEDVTGPDGTTCSCGADPGGFPRQVCLPLDMVPVDWCGNYPEEACDAAQPIQGSDGFQQGCKLVEVQVLTEAGDSCEIAEPQQRCVTYKDTGDDGCGGSDCRLGSLVLWGPIARDEGESIVAFSLPSELCGPLVLGGWLTADDTSFGACAFDCDLIDPCDLSLEAYVDEISQGSKDAPVDDCGAPTLADPVATWEAAQQCALDHATMGQGFTLIVERQGIDSSIREAYVGLQGEVYGVTFLREDVMGELRSLTSRDGAGVTAIDGCTVEPGEPCLELAAPGDVTELCPG